jgi:hypothetical protein
MKHIILLTFCYLIGASIVAQNIPYNTTPDWQSTPNGHIATGLGLADINGDGWKDLVAANGNDILRQHLVVYYNNGDGTFPPDPDWSSEDIDYHGHLSCGDIDHDGDVDVAVSVYLGASGFSSPGRVKVYYNDGDQLESSPSFISSPFFTFSCSLGDADGDGDLDLVTTAGEPYNSILDHGKIFINQDGSFQPAPQWESSIEMGSLDVEFGDMDRDGLMDVIFVCQDDDNYIYAGIAGEGIATTPAWQSAEGLSYINSVDIGYREPGECLVVMTGNSQLGGQGRVRRYLFDGSLPASSTADWYSNPFGYGSGIILADVDLDSKLDLIYGGWWLPMKIALGEPGGFEINPSYTSSTSSVVEAIQMADLGRESVTLKTADFIIDGQSAGGHVIILPDQLVENIMGVTRDGIPVSPENYCYATNRNWISFGEPLQAGETLAVTYEHSPHPDIVITNWDSGKGNYVFYNTNPPVGLTEVDNQPVTLGIFPNPASTILNLSITGNRSVEDVIRITDLSGRELRTFSIPSQEDILSVDISWLKNGVYMVHFNGRGILFMKKG